jgi:hypothetical protein
MIKKYGHIKTRLDEFLYPAPWDEVNFLPNIIRSRKITLPPLSENIEKNFVIINETAGDIVLSETW